MAATKFSFDMTDLQALVLAKAESKLPEADVAPTGKEPVRFHFTVNVEGAYTRAEDGERTPTSRGLTKAAMALFIHRMGAMRDDALDVFMSAVADAAEMDKAAEAELMKVSGVEGALKRLNDRLATDLPKTKTKGAFKLAELHMNVVPGVVLGDTFQPHGDEDATPVVASASEAVRITK